MGWREEDGAVPPPRPDLDGWYRPRRKPLRCRLGFHSWIVMERGRPDSRLVLTVTYCSRCGRRP